jgi:acetyltransferase-like isoleucine patch superfamily enzyme
LLRKIAYNAPGGNSIRPGLHRLRGVNIGKNVWISQYVYIDEIHPEVITIEDNCTIGLNTLIISHLYWGPRRCSTSAGPVHIEQDVFIGPNCVILPNVRIGKGTVIQASTVISKNVPPNTLWGPPKAGPIARITIPLTSHNEYKNFTKGLKPLVPQNRGERNNAL